MLKCFVGRLGGQGVSVTRLPDHGDAQRMVVFLEDHPGWSVFWDKRDGVWRAAEDDPLSEPYVEDADASRVIDYMDTGMNLR
jgi:hypothetical protein